MSVFPPRRGLARRSLLLVLSVFAFLSTQVFAMPSGPAVQFAPTINTFAGNGASGYSGDGGPATSAELTTPNKVAVDFAGNVYVADIGSHTVRKIDATGKITTFAGNGTSGFSGDNGPAIAAQLTTPIGLAVDAAGNVYISDEDNQRIRKVDTSGVITTFAGNGTPGFAGDGGVATSAEFNNPVGIAVDPSGNVYVADYYNNCIRRIDTSGIITTIAGTGTGGYNGDNQLATAAELFYPVSVAVDASGNIYIGDFLNYRVRKIYASTKYIITIAGTGTESPNGPSGDGGQASLATVGYVNGISFDSAGNIYLADTQLQRVRKIAPNGIITNFAGTGTSGSGGDGGPALQASFSSPTSVAIDSKGTIYIADQGNHVIRAVSGDLTVATVSSTATGQPTSANIAIQLNQDTVLGSVDFGSNYSSAQWNDFTNLSLLGGCEVDGITVNPAGSICLFNVTYTPSYPGHRTAPIAVSDASGNQTTLSLAGDATGAAIQLSPSAVTTIPAQATSPALNQTAGLAFDNSNNLYIADTANGRIVTARSASSPTVVNLGGIITPEPMGVATDAQDNLYIVDYDDQYVIKVTPAGVTSTTDVSVATGTGLSGASGIAATDQGDLYIADKNNNRIVKVTAAGVASIFSTGSYTLDGPEGVVIDRQGNVFVADTFDGRVIKVAVDGTASLLTTGSIALSRPNALALDSVGNLFIADFGIDKTIEITTDGTVSSLAGIPGGTGIAVSKFGLLALSNPNDYSIETVSLTQAASLQFSDTVVGQTSTDGSKTVALQNIGNAPLNLTSLTYPTGFAADDNASQPCAAGAMLTPGAACNVSVVFKPTVAGINAGSVNVVTDMYLGTLPPPTIPVQGNGISAVSGFTLTASTSSPSAGTPFSLTIAAVDSNNAAVTDYTGTVHFKSQDAAAILPPDYTFTPADNGLHTFQVTMETTGSQIVTVYDKNNMQLKGQTTVQVDAGTPKTISIVTGDGQSASVGSYFPQELELKVLDQNGNPVPDVTVTYTVPTSGAGISGSSYTDTTDGGGNSYFYVTANGIAGSYQIVASVQGIDTPAIFHLTNTAGATTTALTATPTSGATYGQTVTLAAVVTPTGYLPPAISRSPASPRTVPVSNVGPATGTVTFYDGARVLGTATLGGDANVVANTTGIAQPRRSGPTPGTSATATLTVTAPAAGDHSYTAVYAGDGNFTTSQTTAATTLTVAKAAAVLNGPANQPVSIGSGAAGTVTVTVAAQSAASGMAAPTGTVTYTVADGSAQQAQVSNGQATLQVPSTFAVGSYTISATYSGDSNYEATTAPTAIQLSVVNTVPADFSLTANPSSLTIHAGDTGTATFTFTPVGGFTGNVTFSCGTLPVGVTCSFAPATLTADGSNKVQTSVLTVTTSKLVSANFFLPGALLGGLLFWQRRRFNLRKAQVLMLVLGAAVIAGMAGCGSDPKTNGSISNVTVTATAQASAGGTGTASHTASFTLNITN